jgi:hypothetical protein
VATLSFKSYYAQSSGWIIVGTCAIYVKGKIKSVIGRNLSVSRALQLYLGSSLLQVRRCPCFFFFTPRACKCKRQEEEIAAPDDSFLNPLRLIGALSRLGWGGGPPRTVQKIASHCYENITSVSVYNVFSEKSASNVQKRTSH